MITLADETRVDSRRSVTIEECAAKMLGWMQGTVRLASPKHDEWGVLPDQLAHLYRLEYPLDIHLYHLRERARNELLDAVESDAPQAVVWGKIDAAEHWKELTDKATLYVSNIINELEKGDSSALVIDNHTTEQLNDVHVTLDSLEKWAKQFGVELIGLHSGEAERPARKIKQGRYNALSTELEEILRAMDRPTPSKVMAALRNKIGDPTSCVIVSVGDGLQWEDDLGNMKTLTIDALGERIRYWRKNRENQE